MSSALTRLAVSWTRATSTSTRGRGRGAARRGSRRAARSPDERRRPERWAWAASVVDLVGQLHELGRHQREEPVAQVPDERLGDRARVVPALTAWAIAVEGPARIVLDQRLDELVERQLVAGVAAGVGDQLERRQRVAGRAGALGDGGVDGGVVDVEPGVGGDPADVLGQHVGGQQVEAQVLGAAADRVADLLRVGGGEHEHDVRRRLLERLQQGGLGRPWRACGPRRGCTPCAGRACRGWPSR